jgi:hypothetical protein
MDLASYVKADDRLFLTIIIPSRKAAVGHPNGGADLEAMEWRERILSSPWRA